MAQITLSSFQFQPAASSGYSTTGTTLRVWYSQSFLDSDGTSVQGGNGSSGFYVSVACTISSGVITVPSVTFWTTADAQDPNPQSIQCYAQLFSNGTRKQAVFTQNGTPTGWVIYNPSPASSWTFEALALLNQTSYLANPPQTYPTTQEMINYVNAITYADASTTAKGVTKLSYAPVSSTNPIAVGDNDPRIANGITVITDAPYNADPTGVTDSSSPLQDAINDGCKCIFFPPTLADGVTRAQYLFDPAARSHAGGFNMVTVVDDAVEIFSYGAELILPATTTVTAQIAFIALTLGNKQKVHGFIFNGDTNASGAGSIGAVAISNGAYGAEVYSNYITGFNDVGSAPAGGNLISTYNGGDVYPYPAYQTTLGTAIAAGTRTVTPASMAGIYIGRQLLIDAIVTPAQEERVLVTDVTATTFTATFANSHLATADVSYREGYWQGAEIHDNYFYYNLGATPLVINSRGNRITNNISVQSGSVGTQHGIYMQGGDNYVAGNWFEGVYGYSIHQVASDGAEDMTGNTYIGNWSVDPGTQHVLINAGLANVTNPLFPVGTSMTRYATLKGNHFIKRSALLTTVPTVGVNVFAPAIVEGNFFEDTTAANTYSAGPNTGIQYPYLKVGSHSVVKGNYFYSFASLTTNVASNLVIAEDPGSVAANNCSITGNVLYRVRATQAIAAEGYGNTVTGNSFDAVTGDGNAAVLPLIKVGTYGTVTGNTSAGGNQKLMLTSNLAQTGVTATGNASDSGGAYVYQQGLFSGEGAVLSVSGNAIAPTFSLHKINDAGGLIKNITLPTNFVDGTITLIAGTTPYTTDATGNISRAVSPADGQAVVYSYSAVTSKWNPSI